MPSLIYKLLEDNDGNCGIKPVKTTPGSVCYDLAVPKEIHLRPKVITAIDLLIAFDIGEPYYLEFFPRSSLQTKYGILSSTSIIDTDYTKTCHAILYNTGNMKQVLKKGQRIIQMCINIKQLDFVLVEVDEILQTSRGSLGSTGD
jgi:deoxyuridine 5'-triphosphate nucleotidohydrolase